MIKKISATVMAAGLVAMFLVLSTDDFYTMELHQYHAMDWKAFLLAAVLTMIGAAVYLSMDTHEQ